MDDKIKTKIENKEAIEILNNQLADEKNKNVLLLKMLESINEAYDNKVKQLESTIKNNEYYLNRYKEESEKKDKELKAVRDEVNVHFKTLLNEIVDNKLFKFREDISRDRKLMQDIRDEIINGNQTLAAKTEAFSDNIIVAIKNNKLNKIAIRDLIHNLNWNK